MTSDPTPEIGLVVPQIRLDVRVRRFGGKILITLHDESLELADVAADVFLMIDGTRTVHQLADHLALEYGIPVEMALSDTEELLAELRAGGIVEAAG